MFAARKSIVAWLLVAASVSVCAKDMAVVANKSGSVTTIALPDLIKICKAQTNRWPDGTPVTVVIRDPGAPEMKMVSEKIYGMTADQVRDLITSANHGRNNHPAIVVVTSDEEVIHRVQGTPGMVGLVDVYAITGAVNVVKIGGKLPLEPGYPLHGN